MTISEIESIQPSLREIPNKELHSVYPTLEIVGKIGVYNAAFVNSSHPKIAQAKKIEEDTFVELGDTKEEVASEFEMYDDNSVFVLLEDKKDNDNGIIGMARFIPYTSDEGNKTFNDIATLVGNIKLNQPDFIDINGLRQLTEEPIIETIKRNFMNKYSCDDLGATMDIATLAPDMSSDPRVKMDVIESLLKAMDVFVIDLYRNNKLTHLTQFTVTKMHDVLKEKMGYPMQELFDLPPLVYDTFDNKLGDSGNMIAVPSVIDMKKLEIIFTDAVLKRQATRHMASVAIQLSASIPGFSQNAA